MVIGIYGLGRFGSFWASVLEGSGEIIGYNRSKREFPSFIRPVDIEGLCQADVIWLCSAISSMPEVCAKLAPHLRSGTLVVDTCSVKVFPVKAMLDNFSPDIPILGSHPMFGPDSARNGLSGLPMVISPVRASEEAVRYWKDYFCGCGLRLVVMSPDEHDREAARTQGVTHIIGRFLAELGLQESEIATLGYKKIKDVMEQTCNDPWQLFLDLQRYNPYSAGVRADMKTAFDRLWQDAGFLDSTSNTRL